MQLKLSVVAAAVVEQCGTVVASAVNAENTARDRWSKAGKALYKVGARVEALTKGTKDEPNPSQDDSLIETIEKMITEAQKKPRRACTLRGCDHLRCLRKRAIISSPAFWNLSTSVTSTTVVALLIKS